MTTPNKGSITVASATAIGGGGVMGAGLYTLLGLASTTAGVWLPVAFLVGGAVSVFSVYSYAKLGARYPSRGGAAQFLIRCFGDGVIAGGLNVFQFLGWIIAMALYCAGFAGYVRAMLPWETPAWSGKVIGIVLIIGVVLVNAVGSKLVGRSELFVVSIELAILTVFAVFGLMKSDPARFAENGDHHWLGVLFAAGLLYVTYEGFGVVTNSAGDMKDPAKELPRAMFLALGIVVIVYVVISTIVVMTLSLPSMDANQGHVLVGGGRGGAWPRRLRRDRRRGPARHRLRRQRNDVRRRQPRLRGRQIRRNAKRFHQGRVARRHHRVAHGSRVDGAVRRLLPVVCGGIDGQPGVPDRLRDGQRGTSAGISGDGRQQVVAGTRRRAQRRAVRFARPTRRRHCRPERCPRC